MKGDSLEAAYKHHMKDIYQYLLSLSGNPQIAEDLVHDTFLKAYGHLESYQDEKMLSWFIKVAHNTYLDWYRRDKRQIQTDPSQLVGLSKTVDPGPEVEFLQREKIHAWLEATKMLPEKSRQILMLRDYYDLSYQEIADCLNINLSIVKVSLYRARHTIRELIKDEL